eukprot:5805478-Pleurochrysis_carterae.AAC.1
MFAFDQSRAGNFPVREVLIGGFLYYPRCIRASRINPPPLPTAFLVRLATYLPRRDTAAGLFWTDGHDARLRGKLLVTSLFGSATSF